jgi:hypothetical protein
MGHWAAAKSAHPLSKPCFHLQVQRKSIANSDALQYNFSDYRVEYIYIMQLFYRVSKVIEKSDKTFTVSHVFPF